MAKEVSVSEGIDYYTRLDEGDFSAILNQASALASKYQSLGIELGVSQRDLANIKHENPTDIMRLGDVILKWLQGKEKPTWKVLVEAVYRVDPKHAQGVAKQLRGKDKPYSSYSMQFNASMSDEEFFTFLRNNYGVMRKDIMVLQENGIAARLLPELCDEDLHELGLSFGARKVLKHLITELQVNKTSDVLSGQSTSSMAHTEKYLDERDLTNIYIELQCASAKWFSLGLQLGLPPNNLDEIRLDRLEHPERCLLAVIHTWLKRCAKPTWRDLADALESPTVGYTALARKLQTRALQDFKYMSPTLSPSTATGTTSQSTTSTDKDTDTASEYLTLKEDLNDMSKPNSSNLTVIRWKNERGELEKFRLHVKLVHKWRDIGALVVPRQLLEMWEREKDVSSCCRAVLSYWLDHPTRHYPATWEGLYELLDDIEFKQVAMDLKQAVDNAI